MTLSRSVIEELRALQLRAPHKIPASFGSVVAELAGSGVSIAVIDSGWSSAIEDHRISGGLDLTEVADRDRTHGGEDNHGHGSICALTILSFAPRSRIVPIKIFGPSLDASPRRLILALGAARDLGVDIINLSLSSSEERFVPALYHACEAAKRAGVVLVCAGTNGTSLGFPAIFDNVIGVQAGRTSSAFEYRYREADALECVARGSLHPKARYTTSYATAVVSGITSVLLAPVRFRNLEIARLLLKQHASTEVARPSASDNVHADSWPRQTRVVD